jgi:hypothetical protein
MDTDVAIKSLLEVLNGILIDASELSESAVEAVECGNRNQAIGTILDLEQRLPAAQALYTAALTLHRLPRKGGAQ